MRFLAQPTRRIFLLVMLAGSAVISWASLAYFNPERMAPFVMEKLPLPLEELWLFALKTHVVAAAFSFPACLVLSTRTFLRRAPGLHRHLGRLTGVVVLFALVPSGFYLAFFAKGGWLGTLGFLLTGVIVLGTMVQGVRSARARDFARHRRMTRHVVAQMSVAVVSRLMMLGLDRLGVDDTTAYLLSLWIPVLGSVALVELISARRPSSRSPTLQPA